MLRKPLAAQDEPVPYRFSVTEWHRLGEVGLFEESDRVELLDGEIILMSPIGNRHALALAFLIDILGDVNKRRYLLWPGNPVEADDYSEPLPDLAVLPRTHKGARRHPFTSDTHLIVEIADSSLRHDQGRKLRKYAQSGVVEYWIVNLRDDVIEVYREPRGEEYAAKLMVKGGQSIAPLAFPDVVVPVDEIIPPR
jgi:Uma2 family endonuclease